MAKSYRLGLDIGTNSIGWCVYALDGADRIERLLRMGVRIFPDGRDPQSRTSLAVNRRLARQARRQRQRTVQRRHGFLNELIRSGLLPQDGELRQALVRIDPYELRDRGLREALPLPEFARALYHLARKRGFKSSRKQLAEAADAKESGKIKSGIARLKAELSEQGCQTIGQLLWKRHALRLPVLARPQVDGNYDFYPDRGLVLDEFDRLWAFQRRFHPEALTQDSCRRLRYFIEHQRPLKAVPAGACLLEPGETRCRRGHPMFARFRILSDLANLRIELPNGDAIPLTRRERDVCLLEVEKRGKLTWPQVRRVLGISKDDEIEPFNLARSKKHLAGDQISPRLAATECFGPGWHAFSVDRQADVIEALALAHDDENLRSRLADKGIEVSGAQLAALSRVDVPDGFGELSLKALGRLVAAMERDVTSYDQAVAAAGYGSHSDFLPDESRLLGRLPYYGEILRGHAQPMPWSQVPEEARFGRLPNPTVHVGLNELRKLVNEIIRRYGRPRQIIVELAREFGMSGKRRGELIAEQRRNELANEGRRAELRKRGLPVNRENLMRLRLWEELPILERVCTYSGRAIGQEVLFSDEIEIDHILPFSKSLDDGIGNRVLSFRSANRIKGDRDPHAAFASNAASIRWDEIEARLTRFAVHPAWRRKQRRFLPDALQTFLQERDFLDRHLTDTAYLSRLAKQYLAHVCYKDRVWVATGRLTSMLRGKWGLNDALGGSRKNRNDHRHHAVDAAVIGACDRSVIQRLSKVAEAYELGRSHRFFEQLGQPFDGFSDSVRSNAQRVIVSHRPDHDAGGALHKTTNYSVVEPADGRTPALVAHRVPLTSITDAAKAQVVLDPTLRDRLLEITSAGRSAKEIASALQRWSDETGIRRVRIAERISVIEIPNPNRIRGRAVKTDGNACFEVIRVGTGWRDRVLSRFDASRNGAGSTADVVMRLFDNDLVLIEPSAGERQIMRVVKKSGGQLTLAEHHEAGDLKRRHSDAADLFRYVTVAGSKLKMLRARRVTVDHLGFVHDPGFIE